MLLKESVGVQIGHYSVFSFHCRNVPTLIESRYIQLAFLTAFVFTFCLLVETFYVPDTVRLYITP